MKSVIIITISLIFLFVPISAYESVNDLKNKFESSIIEILSAEPTEKDLEDWRIFLGEERYQKLYEFNAKYDTGFNPGIPLSSQLDVDSSLEQELFVVEIAEYWLEFFKQEMSKRMMKIEDLFKNTKHQINELDLSEDEKFQHINEIEEKKIAYMSAAISGMKDLKLLEDEITQKKKELQIESDLREKFLEFGFTICPEETHPGFDNQGNLTCLDIYTNPIVDTNREIMNDLQIGEIIQDDNQLLYIGIGITIIILILGFYRLEKLLS